MQSEEEYRARTKELSVLVEREDTLDDSGLRHLSDLADALIAFERSTGDDEEADIVEFRGEGKLGMPTREEPALASA